MKSELTPREIVKELDAYIIGQTKAKKAVAIALRNRWRRQHVEGAIKEEIMPNNICLLYTSPSPRDRTRSRMPSSA